MTSSITPIRIAPISDRMIRRKRRRPRMRLGLVACEVLSLAGLFAILLPLVGEVRVPSVTRFLAGWPDLSDAHIACRHFVRQSMIGRSEAGAIATHEVGGWSWLRLEDGRFRILGTLDRPTASGPRRTRYQCDLAPLNSEGRWRVDSLAILREPVNGPTALAPSGSIREGSGGR
jgi:hypothetical protein